jgi:hypothetical protein
VAGDPSRAATLACGNICVRIFAVLRTVLGMYRDDYAED